MGEPTQAQVVEAMKGWMEGWGIGWPRYRYELMADSILMLFDPAHTPKRKSQQFSAESTDQDPELSQDMELLMNALEEARNGK